MIALGTFNKNCLKIRNQSIMFCAVHINVYQFTDIKSKDTLINTSSGKHKSNLIKIVTDQHSIYILVFI